MANKSFVVQYIIKARDQAAPAADKARKAFEWLRKVIERVKVSVQQSMNHIRDALKKGGEAYDRAKAKFEKPGRALRNAGAVMSAAVTAPILLMGKSMIDAARDAGETQSKFDTVFRDIKGRANNTADSLAKSFGLAGDKARQLMGDTGDLLTGFGFSQQAALDMSTRVNELAVDLASFTNYSGGAEGASQALTKALLGERESLKMLGVSIQEQDVNREIGLMMAKGQRFESIRQAKAYATLSLAVKQSGNAIGDYGRTQKDLANQQRLTATRVHELKVAFGKILLPFALILTKAIRRLVEWFTALSPAAKKTIVIFAGIAAALGPIITLVGLFLLTLPAISAGFATLGAVSLAGLAPILAIVAAVAAAAYLVIDNWEYVAAFFKGFGDGFMDSAGPALTKLVDKFKSAAVVIAELFGKDGSATKDLFEFSNVGRLIGSVIGGALDVILRGLSGVGALLGQLAASILSWDFGQFNIDAIKAEFLGETAKPMLQTSRVDVGVNVGLDNGLQQMGAATINGAGNRRTDVGVTR